MSSDAWKKENTITCTVRIQNATGIPYAIEQMMVETGKTRNTYIIEAIREKLQRDGYLAEN